MNKLLISFAVLILVLTGLCVHGSSSRVLSDGISYTHFNYKGNHINVFVVSKKNCVTPVLSNNSYIHSSKSIRTFVKQNPNYIVMVNGTYFSMQTGAPLGLLVINKKMITGDIYQRASIGIWEDKYEIDRVKCNIKINNVHIDNINQPRMLSTFAIMYDSKWGKMSPKTPKYGTQIQIQDNKVTKVSNSSLQIPVNGYVIVGPTSKLHSLKVNDRVSINIETTPNWSSAKHIVSGGPIIVKDSKVFIDVREEKLLPINGRYNRTAIGYDNKNNLVILIADGSGLTLNELANLMLQFNCVRAMNLDGGGSTSLYIKGIGNKVAKQARYLSNVLIVR